MDDLALFRLFGLGLKLLHGWFDFIQIIWVRFKAPHYWCFRFIFFSCHVIIVYSVTHMSEYLSNKSPFYYLTQKLINMLSCHRVFYNKFKQHII